MKLLKSWQYKYIEGCLYKFKELENQLSLGTLAGNELKMLEAIQQSKEFFKDTLHEKMMQEYYFNANFYREEMTNNEHYSWVCKSILHMEQPNGYVIRREIVYRVAMFCYKLQLFSN